MVFWGSKVWNIPNLFVHLQRQNRILATPLSAGSKT